MTGICCAALLWTNPVAARVTEEEAGHSIAISQLPGTTVTEKSYDKSFMSLTGYVEKGISDRSVYYDEYVKYNEALKEQFVAEGGKEEEYVWQDTASYRVVHNEQEFCDAIVSYAEVVELAADLNLGYKYLDAQGVNTNGVVKQISDYSKGNAPISSPDLMRDGVSRMNLQNRNGFMLYSRNGSTIYHCEIGITNCNDVVIRNIGIQGLNEWDDLDAGMSGTPGGHKRYDWDNISVFESKNVWIDHCSLGIAYDGSVDITDASTVTLSWNVIGEPDERLMQEMQNTMDYMEEKYKKGEGLRFYTALRDGGATKEQIMAFSLLNDKVHAFSCSEGYYEKNIYDRITMAFNFYKNSCQRVPQIRCGNAHMYNCWINSDDYIRACEDMAEARSYAGKKGCSVLGLCRANSALGGSTIGTDTCVFEGVINPIIGSEIQGFGTVDLGYQYGAVNHNLIVNSSTRRYGKESYIGSSWDNNGDNAFVTANHWNGNKVSFNDFKWAKWKDITKDASKASDTVIYLPESEAAKFGYGEFYEKFYIGTEELGYDYQIVPLEEVKDTLTKYSGCGKVSLSGAEWLQTEYETEKTGNRVVFDFQDGAQKAQEIIKNVASGSCVSVPDVEEREGYTFASWYTKEYYADENGEAAYREIPFTEETPVSQDTYVFAKWDRNIYRLSLELNGGTAVNPENTVFECLYNSIFLTSKLNSLVEREGYVLEGWYTDAGLTNRVSSMRILQNTVLYAKWKEAPEASEKPQISSAPKPSGTEPDDSQAPTPSKGPEKSPGVTGTGTPIASPEASKKPAQQKGDVDGNGKIELHDAQMALKKALNLITLDTQQKEAADYDGNGKVELSDAQMILKKALNLI